MTPLGAILLGQIEATGPMTVAEFMNACLLHPAHGYYTRRDPLGRDGDFVTAPEISQMFGELLGLALAQAWQDQGQPAPFVLAELGPGRGTLMADALRATENVPGFHAAMRLALVDVSEPLRAEQAARLGRHDPIWPASVGDLPYLPLFLIANEFFDALPVRQFLRDGNGWRERLIAAKDGALTFGLGPVTALAALDGRAANQGDLIETCAPAEALTAEVAARIAAYGGAALILDYGDWAVPGDTLQAVRAHRKIGPLDAPGDSDLTAHVDFASLARAAARAGAAHSPMVPQGVFLERLGITARARQLAAGNTKAREALIAAHRRLTHPREMGHLFKAMALYPPTASTPPGFE